MFERIKRDIQVVFERDPAARSVWEVLLAYPGFHALQVHRVAHWLYRHRRYVVARLVSHLGRWLTGIEIHPGARLGEGLFIDHGMGVVIGETAEVGDNVTLYQGVVLGGTGKERGKRHPTIGDNVVIAAGAKVLGSFRVGDGAKIGAGAVVLREVPPHSTVVGVPGRVVMERGKRVDSIDLDHASLPDPVEKGFRVLQHRIEELEARIRELEKGLWDGEIAATRGGQAGAHTDPQYAHREEGTA
ncbi:serine O-acetyltransferase [Limnochorda pilosa]|uniref:Serine acetyltransferase n=1 Tax=Limnochorda pilosa TaxID=1555112 RepID=A0A0K2SPR5_LIMPI|nr:serine acetyltransferase [Limnochorda pilosa]